ncbi:MAG TPA: hypothetical protein VMW62_13140, partial [Chloroflexota bacterium]|nr:hypothetical protein [Chloroflexota bacterium]
VRCLKLALDNGLSGTIEGPSAYFMKSPPVQYADSVARQMTESFIDTYGAGVRSPESGVGQPAGRDGQAPAELTEAVKPA